MSELDAKAWNIIAQVEAMLVLLDVNARLNNLTPQQIALLIAVTAGFTFSQASDAHPARDAYEHLKDIDPGVWRALVRFSLEVVNIHTAERLGEPFNHDEHCDCSECENIRATERSHYDPEPKETE